MKLTTQQIKGEKAACSIAEAFIRRSAWFAIEPRPSDWWEFSFKAGEGHEGLFADALDNLVRELFTHVDAKGHPQTQADGASDYDVLVPIPASLLRRLRVLL